MRIVVVLSGVRVSSVVELWYFSLFCLYVIVSLGVEFFSHLLV